VAAAGEERSIGRRGNRVVSIERMLTCNNVGQGHRRERCSGCKKIVLVRYVCLPMTYPIFLFSNFRSLFRSLSLRPLTISGTICHRHRGN
jgi:hypothetical protein